MDETLAREELLGMRGKKKHIPCGVFQFRCSVFASNAPQARNRLQHVNLHVFLITFVYRSDH